ncbi:ATP-grasp domain-containing protein [Plantactinospora sp. CA-290183]|uniref:ATP-grasp domain-containing protein n=1 Tax=Plantactinospora sp. CA-290183 TaxID=3240006 RepID=UPI003D8F8EA9
MPLSDIQAARGRPRVALVTCAEIPDLEDDDRLLLAPLAQRGVIAEPVVWDAPDVDWAGYPLAVLRSPWDYPRRRDEFVAWAATVPRLANPADLVRWNTDKRYLGELSAAGVPTVPTTWLDPASAWRPPDRGEYVVKPAVGAGSLDTGRYDLADPEQRRLASAHVRRLQAAGRHAMVQPYLTAVDTDGETALLYVGGPDGPAFSHAIRKGAMLTGPDTGASAEELFRAERIDPRTPSQAELAVAERVLAALPGGPERVLYARVDLIPGSDGAPVLVEVELTEPSLFLAHAEGAAERFAEAIAGRVNSPASC